MKTLPRTLLIVITAISLLSVAAGLVFAKPHTPRSTFRFHLELKEATCVKGDCGCAKGDCVNVKVGYYKALCDWNSNRSHNKHDHHIRFNEEPWDGDYSRDDGRPNNNVTQHLATQNAKDLVEFLTTAGIIQ